MSGSTQTKTEIPKWLEDASRGNLAMGNDVANIGYVPYYGPDVAAFTPMQQASFQNTGQAANAFGMAGGGLTGMEGMPQAQQFAGGVSGYSSAPMFAETMAALECQCSNRHHNSQAVAMTDINQWCPATTAAIVIKGQTKTATLAMGRADTAACAICLTAAALARLATNTAAAGGFPH